MKENIIKYVIAKTIGPTENVLGIGKGCLTIGKSYEAINITYQKNDNSLSYLEWVVGEFKHNPAEPMFYITIKDNNDQLHSIWNDCFYSTEHMRELVIDGILE